MNGTHVARNLDGHHWLKHQAQVSSVVEVPQQADDVALVVGVRGAQLAQYNLLSLAAKTQVSEPRQHMHDMGLAEGHG